MILEQDFILHLRRLQRLSSKHGVALVALSQHYQTPESLSEATEELQTRLQKTGGRLFTLSNGDVGIIFNDEVPPTLPRLLAPAGKEDIVRLYQLPADYLLLRERLNVYLEKARGPQPTILHLGESGLGLANALRPQLSGRLTAHNLAQLEETLEKADINRYVRRQGIYRWQDGRWQRLRDEWFVSLASLQQELFPDLDIGTPPRLFLELCAMLDQRLLQVLIDRAEHWLGQNVSFNLAIDTPLKPIFVQFCHLVTGAARNQVMFELKRADLLLDFELSASMLGLMRQNGFLVALDGVPPGLLPLLNSNSLPVDYLKLAVPREQTVRLRDKGVSEAIQRFGPERIILSRCDSEATFKLGQELGIRMFQGWLIDDLAK